VDHPIALDSHALVFMTGRNCEMYVGDALKSLARQTHDEVHVLFVDDASEDATADIARHHLAALFPGRHTMVVNDVSWGKARSASTHLRALAPQYGFVAVLDADDQLIEPTILATMAREYAEGCDVVWTNFVTDRGGTGRNQALDPTLSPRLQGWRTSHFFSFRASLFANVDPSYFQDDDGRWLTAACDFAIAFPILDQTRRYRFLPVNAYRYTASNPYSHHNLDPQSVGLSSRHQAASARIVLAKPALPCTRPAREAVDPVSAAAAVARPWAPVVRERTAAPTVAATDPWSAAAAAELVRRCPRVLAALRHAPAAAADPVFLNDLHAAVGRARRVLEIGASPLLGWLAAFAADTGTATITSLAADTDRINARRRELRLAGAETSVQIIESRWAELTLGDTTGYLPDPGALDGQAPFDLVIVAPDAWGARVAANLALPAVAPLLSLEGFTVHLQGVDADVQQDAAAQWRALAPELELLCGDFGGSVLTVISGATN
jgi:Glycosyltransferases involved in cell wall biogenesis